MYCKTIPYGDNVSLTFTSKPESYVSLRVTQTLFAQQHNVPLLCLDSTSHRLAHTLLNCRYWLCNCLFKSVLERLLICRLTEINFCNISTICYEFKLTKERGNCGGGKGYAGCL